MSELPTQLVCRPRPLPDESLLSYLLRVQVDNDYERLVWLTSWLRTKTACRTHFRPTTTKDTLFLENLATVTAVPVFDLYRMTLHRYVPLRTFPGRPVQYYQLSSGERAAFCPQIHSMMNWCDAEFATSFCPHCLRQSPYHHLDWMLDIVFACPEHGCWLHNACFNCGSQVSIEAITRSQCTVCSASLADMPVTPLDATGLSVQQHLLTCITTGEFPTNTLPPISVQALFRFLEGLCAVTRIQGWEWKRCYQPEVDIHPLVSSKLHNLSPTQSGYLYTNAWLAANDWPNGFYDFLDRYTRDTSNGIKDSLGSFYGIWLEKAWLHPDFEPIQKAFNNYLMSHFPPTRLTLRLDRMKRHPELREQTKWLDTRNAGRLLGVAAVTIKRMVRDGYVRTFPSHEQPSSFVYREDLETGLQQRSIPVTLGQVATEFATTGGIVQEWIDARLMPQTGSRLVRSIPHPSLTREDVNCFLKKLINCACVQPERPVHTMSLKSVCSCNNKIGISSVRVIQCVLEGILHIYHTDPQLQPFCDLWFDPQEVDTLTSRLKDVNNWMSLREIPVFLHVELKMVRHWVQQGLLIPVAQFSRSIYFDRTEVTHFKQRLLLCTDVANWIEASVSALNRWVGAGYLSVLNATETGKPKAYRFDRDVVAQWHQRYVTFREARRLLGLKNYFKFRKMVLNGEFASPIPPDVRDKFYYRDELAKFQTILEQQL